jgi:hypothetical protein
MTAIVTRVAHTGADELRFHGHKVFAELLGRTSLGQMLILGVSGDLLDERRIAVIDDIVTAMSSADPRLWPFKVTRLGASLGNAAYGVGATLVAGEGGMYGSNRLAQTADWLSRTVQRIDVASISDDDIEKLLVDHNAGFGVLYRSRDERFEALLRRRGDTGDHTRFCLHAARVARERKQSEAHVYLAVAALCLDVGLSVEAISALGIIFLFHDALANAVEGARQAPPLLQCLPQDHVEYRGRSARRSTRAITSVR